MARSAKPMIQGSEVSTCVRPLSVELWPLSRLTRYDGNARTHTDKQVAEIASSICEFGFSNPILAGPSGDIIAGHGRFAAAQQLRLQEVPVIVLADLSELQRRQLRLADNRIAMNAGWDLKALSLELTDFAALGVNLSSLGFSNAELSAALSSSTSGLVDEDDVPDYSENAVSHPGDIWALDSHRVACGDSTDAELVTRLFGGEVPHLMVTDPPYGVAYDPEWRHRAGMNKSQKRGRIKNDERADWTPTWSLFPGDIAYVWHGALHATTVAESLMKTGFTIRSQIVWAKERLVMSRGDYHWQHEPCWYAVRKKGNWTGDRKQTTLWKIATGGQDEETAHSTQKPVECMRRPILNNSEPGEYVYEPFLGSGTTLIAAQSVDRICLGIEIDPIFVDVAVRRWQAFTGKSARRLSDGVEFSHLEAFANSGLTSAKAIGPSGASS